MNSKEIILRQEKLLNDATFTFPGEESVLIESLGLEAFERLKKLITLWATKDGDYNIRMPYEQRFMCELECDYRKIGNSYIVYDLTLTQNTQFERHLWDNEITLGE